MVKFTSSLTPAQALIKAGHYCAYQERCHAEVIEKLSQWGIYGQDADMLVLNLIEQGYLNEERFAKAFAGGKFRTKLWGRLRIVRELKMRQVSEYCIRQALAEIDEADYKVGMHKLIRQKLVLLKEKNPLVKKNKTAAYLIGKGFEPDQVWNVLRSMNL